MKVLIACEFSGAVRDAFRRRAAELHGDFKGPSRCGCDA